MKHIFSIVFLAFVLVAGGPVAGARCKGTDYRTQLTPEQITRLKTEAQNTPFAYGNHWIATKGNRRIHVIGTMHTGDRRLNRVFRGLRPVLARADAVLFEITADELREQAREFPEIIRRNFLLPGGQSLKRISPPETWETLSRIGLTAGFEPEELDRFQPWAASFMLLGENCRQTGLTAGRGLDARLESFARRKGIPTGSLETEDESWSAFGRSSYAKQMRSLELELALRLSGAPVNASLTPAYFDQAVWEGFILHRWEMYQFVDASRREIDQHWERFVDDILSSRNQKWIPRILATKGDVIVVAVGAAHLPGRKGVVNLLKSKGFRLERGSW